MLPIFTIIVPSICAIAMYEAKGYQSCSVGVLVYELPCMDRVSPFHANWRLRRWASSTYSAYLASIAIHIPLTTHDHAQTL